MFFRVEWWNNESVEMARHFSFSKGSPQNECFYWCWHSKTREFVKPFFQNYHDFFGHELKSSFKTSLIHSIAHATLVNICRCWKHKNKKLKKWKQRKHFKDMSERKWKTKKCSNQIIHRNVWTNQSKYIPTPGVSQ